MSLFLSLLPLIAQIGPFSTPGVGPGPKIPQGVERPARSRPEALPAPLPAPRADDGLCPGGAEATPAEAVELASNMVAAARADAIGQGQMCLGLAYVRGAQWDLAEEAFLAARDSAGSARLPRARYGAMAGNAALAGNAPFKALSELEAAAEDARGAAEPALLAGIAVDRARALVALKREAEAATALTEATSADPANAEAWLLGATLARRQGKLDEAQRQIEKAADLAPLDPDIGLEAGVIAALSGRDEAARKSWQSVIGAAPASAQAGKAKAYLEQLGPLPAASGK